MDAKEESSQKVKFSGKSNFQTVGGYSIELKKNGIIVADDKLIASKANDVEKKVLSNRKSRGEGPVSDCIADSCVNTMLGIRICIKGETQLDNVKELMKKKIMMIMTMMRMMIVAIVTSC